MSTSHGNAGSAWKNLAADLPASLVVFLVALPLCMGIALASGAPIVSGLIAGVVGGVVVGLLGGAPMQVSGPAAGLAVMVFGFIQTMGLAMTCAAVAAAGLLQMAFGGLKVARAALAISPAVIHGMLAGIGILIVLGQIHIVLGGSPQSSAWQNIKELPEQLIGLHGPAALLGLVTIGLMVVWPFIGKGKLKLVPAPLVAVVGATAVSVFWGADVARVQLPENVFSSIQLPALPAAGSWGTFIAAVLSLALVASAESLLCAVATDKMHTGPRANLDKELFAQGVANTVSGLIGGLPITGVIVRSAANLAAGAKSRWSAVMHGLWLLLFVTTLGSVAGLVPLTVLAGLLVVVGTKLVNLHHIRELQKRGEVLVYAVTVAGVVGINLLAGIGLGLLVAILRLLWRLGSVKVDVKQVQDEYLVQVSGSLTFVGVPRLSMALAQVPAGSKVRVDLAVDTLDHSGFEAIESWSDTHRKTGGSVVMESLEEVWVRSGTSKTSSPVLGHQVPNNTLASEGAR
ncbi:SulP family inorganic anion transporter [Myxococcus sp. MISCRS1]|uniref:SulP family inorganic anion transporter n=1 Tax=Myxococcus TaxID=32 RepID=UPI001CBDE952|nr:MULTISPECIES: SulP family inorganic anion transporter [unclassified Myxococcus]MBZ4401887.1 SulP family inorganic anion transporter [Myxococcus sp. AS-1-15]MBZ4407306.1 SulP family inorganic anion transporter [Myxococcus sp. XM-1-1-1]MCY1002510.1 SulP family inorganic anion transporter [Myxococcus sp. MISCRS1]BDT35922.1 SulP family inorganic anion transporter [Myxococcus sp. MH1]